MAIDYIVANDDLGSRLLVIHYQHSTLPGWTSLLLLLESSVLPLLEWLRNSLGVTTASLKHRAFLCFQNPNFPGD